jgi:hypothetical protein
LEVHEHLEKNEEYERELIRSKVMSQGKHSIFVYTLKKLMNFIIVIHTEQRIKDLAKEARVQLTRQRIEERLLGETIDPQMKGLCALYSIRFIGYILKIFRKCSTSNTRF